MEDYLWVEKYRPKTIQNTILPEEIKKTFLTFIESKNIPNLLLTGGAGVGKTTVARAMLEEIDADYLIINGSVENGIDTLRSKIMSFASSTSLSGERKYIILDEADYLTPWMQPALRNFMEEFSKNCGFILTCNFRNKIIEPLQSRCSVVEFKIRNSEKPELAKQFMKRLATILETEKIEYDPKVLPAVIKKFFPDWRKMINEIQYYSATGKIDTGMLINLKDIALQDLLVYMKEKNFTNVRKWVAENTDMESAEFYRKFYDHASNIVASKDIPYLVLLIAKYSYQDPQTLDKQINTTAFLVEVMANCEML